MRFLRPGRRAASFLPSADDNDTRTNFNPQLCIHYERHTHSQAVQQSQPSGADTSHIEHTHHTVGNNICVRMRTMHSRHLQTAHLRLRMTVRSLRTPIEVSLCVCLRVRVTTRECLVCTSAQTPVRALECVCVGVHCDCLLPG